MTKSSLILWRAVPRYVSAPNFHLEPLERRYFLSAQVDPTFGDQGHAFVPGPPVYAVLAVQGDERIILSGNNAATHADDNLAILKRLLPDGASDPTFHPPSDLHVLALQIRIQQDGKILLVNQNNLVRLEADGSVDPTFHFAAPLSQEDPSYSIEDAALLPDGRILTVGQHYQQDVIQEVVSRYNSDGSLDFTFGQNGVVTPLPDGAIAWAVRMTGDGHLLLLASINANTQTPNDSLWQLDSDGSIDPTFGNGGRVLLPASAWASDFFRWPQDPLLIQPDGKIIVGVTREWPDGDWIAVADDLVRYTPNGDLDPTFANAGVAEINSYGQALDMILQANGKIVVALGNFYDPTDSPNFTHAAGLLRFNPEGVPDTSFGTDGIFLPDGTLQGDAQILLQGDKIILLANDSGAPQNDPGQFFHVVRVEDVTVRAPDDTPIPLAPSPNPLPRWSENPIFQDATDELDWSQLKQPWD